MATPPPRKYTTLRAAAWIRAKGWGVTNHILGFSRCCYWLGSVSCRTRSSLTGAVV